MTTTNQKEYPRLQELNDLCQSFKGQTIQLEATFQGHRIQICNPNLVGDLLEDIFFTRFKEVFPDFEEGPKQDPPDYYAGGREFAFEQKAFCGSPGFDISNFTSFLTQISKDGGLVQKVFKTKYLVFQYAVKDNAFQIVNFWLLNIWQLPNYDLSKPLSIQDKKGVWYNFRPGPASSWKDEKKTAERFVRGLLECIEKCPHLQNKEMLRESIVKQMEQAKIQGFL